jgi:HEAT repeat protein
VVSALGNYPNDQVVDLLQKAISTDSSYNTEAAAVASVAKIGGNRAFDVVSTGLKQDSFRELVRQASLKGLATLKDPQALPVFTEYLKYGQPRVLRTTAVQALVDFGPGNEKVGQTLIPFLADNQDTMRIAVANALADLGVESAIGPLTTMSESDPRDDVKAAAKVALAKLTAKLKE